MKIHGIVNIKIEDLIMAYDPEKYKKKREKVLGIRKSGLSFGSIATIVAFTIILGIGFIFIPQTISYIKTKNLDDAIFKLNNNEVWTNHIISQLQELNGITDVVKDKNNTRLVITFDRRVLNISKFDAIFKNNNLQVTLLNQINHSQHQAILRQDEKLEN